MSNPSHYPHKCPECGAAAYIGGANNVECTGGACRNMSAEVKPPYELEFIGLKCVTPPEALPKDKSRQIKGSCADVCPTPEEYVGELLRSGSSDLVDQHLRQADVCSHVMWENQMWDVSGPWCQTMAKEIRRRLTPTGHDLAKFDTSPKMSEVHLNAGQLGLLEEAHEALKISITNDPRDCRRIESLQERIAKSLCSIPEDTVQVPRKVLEECRKLAHLEYQRILRGVTPMPERVSSRLEKKFLGLWQTLRKLVPVTPTRKESSS